MKRRSVTVSVLALAALAAPAHAALVGDPETVVPTLSTPWEVVPVPDGRTLVTERPASTTGPGRIRIVAANGDLCPGAAYTGATGSSRKFLGLALHPAWAQNGLAYLYETYTGPNGDRSRIVRLRDTGATLAFDRVIFDGIGSDRNHDGGRMAFGPDGKLYVTTGDIHQKSLPRDATKLNGKILRLEAPGTDADGSPVADNPWFGLGGDARFVYSKGHRHPQGLAWDGAGNLWETEHGPSGEGPSGATHGHDELNLIEKGGDYGWPDVAGGQALDGTIPPKVHSGPPPAWAPGDLAFAADGALYAPMLNGAHLRRFVISGKDVVSQEQLFKSGTASEYGRLRVGVAEGNVLWFTQDGSGADLMRVGIDAPLPALGTGDCTGLGTGPVKPKPEEKPAPETPGGGTAATETPTAPVTGLPLGLPQPPAPAAADAAAALDRLLARAGTTLRRSGALRRLLRTGRAGVRAGGLARGRLVLRVRMRAGGRLVTVAQGTAEPRSRSGFTLTVRVTKRGRALLRGRSRARLVLTATHQPASGARVARTLSLTARR